MIAYKRYSRILLVQYIFSNKFNETSIEKLIEDLKKIDSYLEEDIENYEITNEILYSEELLNELIKIYQDNFDNIWEEVTFHCPSTDNLLLSILAAGITEIIHKQKKLKDKYKIIITEYMKISDLFDLPSNIVNAVLNKSINNYLS